MTQSKHKRELIIEGTVEGIKWKVKENESKGTNKYLSLGVFLLFHFLLFMCNYG
jgi:hypothetical protein